MSRFRRYRQQNGLFHRYDCNWLTKTSVMKENGADQVITSHPAKKQGISIPKDIYKKLSDFIVHELLNHDEHTVITLLDEAEQTFSDIPNLFWYLMHVRLDLEAKGYLRLTEHKDLNNRFLRITHRGMRRLAGAGANRSKSA